MLFSPHSAGIDFKRQNMTSKDNPHTEKKKIKNGRGPITLLGIQMYLFIETYLYRVDIISRQAIFLMCAVVISYRKNKQSII